MKKLFCLVILFLAVPFVKAQDSMKKLLSTPDNRIDSVFMGIDLNTRLDMIDYFEAGQPAFSIGDGFKSEIRISELDNRHVRLITPTPLAVDAYLLTPGDDTLIVFVVSAPIDNGDVIVRAHNINTGEKTGFINPQYSDWLKKDALKKVSRSRLMANVPFVTAKAEVDTLDNTITLVNSAVGIPGQDEEVTALFLPRLTYRWNGRNFVKL